MGDRDKNGYSLYTNVPNMVFVACWNLRETWAFFSVLICDIVRERTLEMCFVQSLLTGGSAHCAGLTGMSPLCSIEG